MNTKHRIKIQSIESKVMDFRGFDHVGCHQSTCADACCAYGCDIDKETYDQILLHHKAIEEIIPFKVTDCFTGGWSGDSDYLGGNSTESKTKNGYCMFHMPEGKGCVLYHLVEAKGFPRRLIPSICRLYPLTWGGDELSLADDFYPKCNCLHKNKTQKTIIETEWSEIEDIFELDTKLVHHLFHRTKTDLREHK